MEHPDNAHKDQPDGRESLHSAKRSSAGTAGAAASVEMGWRVKVTESMANRAAPAVVQPRLRRLISWGRLHDDEAGALI